MKSGITATQLNYQVSLFPFKFHPVWYLSQAALWAHLRLHSQNWWCVTLYGLNINSRETMGKGGTEKANIGCVFPSFKFSCKICCNLKFKTLVCFHIETLNSAVMQLNWLQGEAMPVCFVGCWHLSQYFINFLMHCQVIWHTYLLP